MLLFALQIERKFCHCCHKSAAIFSLSGHEKFRAIPYSCHIFSY